MNTISHPSTVIDIIRLVGAGVVGGIIGACANDFFTRRRERQSRKANFRGFISGLKVRADKTEDVSFAEWFAKSQIEMERECGILGSVGWRHQKRFTIARAKYANAKRNDIQDFDNATSPLHRFMTFNAGRGLAKDLIQEMIDCVSI